MSWTKPTGKCKSDTKSKQWNEMFHFMKTERCQKCFPKSDGYSCNYSVFFLQNAQAEIKTNIYI